MITRKKLNEDFKELKLTYEPTDKDWYVDDERVDSITNRLEDVQIDADKILEGCDKQIESLEKARDEQELLIGEIEDREPEVQDESNDDEWDKWSVWNDEFLEAQDKLNELESKIDALENIGVYLREISASIDNLVD